MNEKHLKMLAHALLSMSRQQISSKFGRGDFRFLRYGGITEKKTGKVEKRLIQTCVRNIKEVFIYRGAYIQQRIQVVE